jgi:hypothetical protein
MVKRQVMVDIGIKTGFYAVLSRVNQKLERVFSEFVDNSLQSYLDHADELKNLDDGGRCIVTIKWDKDSIVIHDNSYGMSEEDFNRALRLNAPKDHYSPDSLSQYGMGLKYAAVYLGRDYTILSTQYNATEQYFAEMDMDYLKKENPESIPCQITDAIPSRHETEITIKRLNEKLTATKQRNLIKKLGVIYEKFLADKTLKISINGVNVQYVEPEIRHDPDTDSELMAFIENGTFEHNGEQYVYDGWVGILATASLDDAGLSLKQNGRVIQLNYRPEELFGKGNDYRYQRIFGSINFKGTNWKISFNKDGFLWGDDGLEDAFIQSLEKNNPKVATLFKVAKKLRKDSPASDPNRTAQVVQTAFGALSGEEKPVVSPKKKSEPVTPAPLPESLPNSVVSVPAVQPEVSGGASAPTDVPPTQPVAPTSNEVPASTEQPKPVAGTLALVYQSVTYTLATEEINDENKPEWIELIPIEGQNCYHLTVNFASPLLNKFQDKTKIHDLIIKLAAAICLARLSSVRLGVKLDDTDKYMDELNNIISKIS